MGRRTGKNPSPDQTFLVRICNALDETPRELAKNIGVKYKELEPFLAPRYTLVEMDIDDVWWRIGEYVDERLGFIMAARMELNKALEKDRAARIARLQRFKTHHGT